MFRSSESVRNKETTSQKGTTYLSLWSLRTYLRFNKTRLGMNSQLQQ